LEETITVQIPEQRVVSIVQGYDYD